MDELDRAAELIDRALDALSIAAARHPALGEDFARRCEHLRQLRAEIDVAIGRTQSEPSGPNEITQESRRSVEP